MKLFMVKCTKGCDRDGRVVVAESIREFDTFSGSLGGFCPSCRKLGYRSVTPIKNEKTE